MSYHLVLACLLLLSLLHLVDGARSPADYRELVPRGQHLQKGLRTHRMDEGKLIKIIDVSDDDDQESDTEGEYTGAFLTKPGMPESFTVCGAFRTEVWTTIFQSTVFFQWNEEDGETWGSIILVVAKTGTIYDIYLGNVTRSDVQTEKVYFPFDWVRFCASLDTESGSLVFVVDGQVLLEESNLANRFRAIER